MYTFLYQLNEIIIKLLDGKWPVVVINYLYILQRIRNFYHRKNQTFWKIINVGLMSMSIIFFKCLKYLTCILNNIKYSIVKLGTICKI